MITGLTQIFNHIAQTKDKTTIMQESKTKKEEITTRLRWIGSQPSGICVGTYELSTISFTTAYLHSKFEPNQWKSPETKNYTKRITEKYWSSKWRWSPNQSGRKSGRENLTWWQWRGAGEHRRFHLRLSERRETRVIEEDEEERTLLVEEEEEGSRVVDRGSHGKCVMDFLSPPPAFYRTGNGDSAVQTNSKKLDCWKLTNKRLPRRMYDYLWITKECVHHPGLSQLVCWLLP